LQVTTTSAPETALPTRVPLGRFEIRVLESTSDNPIAGAMVVCVPQGSNTRGIVLAKSRTLGTTDGKGRCILDGLAISAGSLVVCHRSYASARVPSQNEGCVTIRLDSGNRVIARCVDEATGVPVPGVLVAMSHLNIAAGTFDDGSDVYDYCGADSSSAVFCAVSDTSGSICIDGVVSGRLRAMVRHPTKAVVAGFAADREQLLVPCAPLEIVLRDLEGVAIAVDGAAIVGYGKRPRSADFDPSATFAAAAAFHALRAKWPSAALFVGLPRARGGTSSEVPFHLLLDNGARIAQSFPLRRLEDLVEPITLPSAPAAAMSLLTIDIQEAGRPIPGLPLVIVSEGAELKAQSGKPLLLPSGDYYYRVANEAMSLVRDVGDQAVSMDGRTDVHKQHELRHRYAPCSIRLAPPFTATATRLVLSITEDGAIDHYYNWIPRNQRTPIYLKRGRCSVRVAALDFVSEQVELDVAEATGEVSVLLNLRPVERRK
jgi:hypothetical protein